MNKLVLFLVLIIVSGGCRNSSQRVEFNQIPIAIPDAMKVFTANDSIPPELRGLFSFEFLDSIFLHGKGKYLGIMQIDRDSFPLDFDIADFDDSVKNIYSMVYPYIEWEPEGTRSILEGVVIKTFHLPFKMVSYFGYYSIYESEDQIFLFVFSKDRKLDFNNDFQVFKYLQE